MHTGCSVSSSSFFTGDSQNLNAPIVLDEVNCFGTEAEFTECQTKDYGTARPFCGSVVGVMCEGTSILHNFVSYKALVVC